MTDEERKLLQERNRIRRITSATIEAGYYTVPPKNVTDRLEEIDKRLKEIEKGTVV